MSKNTYKSKNEKLKLDNKETPILQLSTIVQRGRESIKDKKLIDIFLNGTGSRICDVDVDIKKYGFQSIPTIIVSLDSISMDPNR